MSIKSIKLTKSNLKLHIDGIVSIHLASFSKKHLTANFSKEKLKEYYEDIINASDLSLIVVNDDPNESGKKDLAGFIVSGTAVSKGVNEFLNNNRLYVLSILITHPVLFFEKLRTTLKRRKTNTSATSYRLLSIAINKNSQSQGRGSFLLANLEDALVALNIESYGLSVKKDNFQAIKFYNKNGFVIETETDGSIYYKKTLIMPA